MDVNAIVDLFRKTVTEHYFDTNGRVGRKQFWWWVGACVAVFVACSIIDAILGLGIIRPLVGLALLLPMAGMGIRRLQDTGRNGTLMWAAVALSAILQIIALLFALSGPLGAYALLGTYMMLGGLVTLLSLASLVIAIALIYFWIQPGMPEANAYGPPPPDFDPMTPPTPKTP